jgi:hypothetical protein
MNWDPDLVAELRWRGAAVENAASAAGEIPPCSPGYDENPDEACLLAARGTDAGRRLTDHQAGPAAAIVIRHEVPVSAVWPDARPDWATLFGGRNQLTISAGDVWTPGAGRALLQRMLEGRTATVASSRRPPAERAVGATGPSTRDLTAEPDTRAIPPTAAATGPQSRSSSDRQAAEAQGQRSLPWPPTDALPSTAVNRGPSSALPLLAIIARVSLAIAVRDAAANGLLHGDAAPNAKSGPLQPTPRVPLVALDGARQPGVDSPHQRYGPSGLNVVEPRSDQESSVTSRESRQDSPAYVNEGVGS